MPKPGVPAAEPGLMLAWDATNFKRSSAMSSVRRVAEAVLLESMIALLALMVAGDCRVAQRSRGTGWVNCGVPGAEDTCRLCG